MRYACVCCGSLTLEGPPGTTNDICPVCEWEDDSVDNQDTDVLGPNRVRLSVARENFARYGTSDPQFLPLLHELIERYGEDAVVSVDRYDVTRLRRLLKRIRGRARTDDEGKFTDHVNTRWVVSIDGAEVPDVEVIVGLYGELLALVFVKGDGEVEMWHWNPTTPNAAIKEPGRIVDTLGGLKRRTGYRGTPRSLAAIPPPSLHENHDEREN
jgi:hypothetical protein